LASQNKSQTDAPEMGLFRKAIVVGVILFALPSPPPQPGDGANASLQSSSFAAFTAAADTFADFKGFCERRPQACVTGQYLTALVEGKLRYGAKLAYEWANPQAAQQAAKQADALATPALPARPDGKAKPPLRLATINDAKPKSIEDLLHGSSD
jgi:hypothetical protein